MALSVIVSALSAINSALKIVDFVEAHGFLPEGEQLIALNLEIAREQPSLQTAAVALNSSISDAEDELIEDTQKRVAACLRSLNDAMNDPDHLPDERRRFGVSARKCICREVGVIRDLNVGSLPYPLDKLWGKYKCFEVNKPKLPTPVPFETA